MLSLLKRRSIPRRTITSYFKRWSKPSEPEYLNEPTGILFGMKPGQRIRDVMTTEHWIFICGYIVPIAFLYWVWQYKPDSSAERWGKQEAIKRMKARGVDLSLIEEELREDGFEV